MRHLSQWLCMPFRRGTPSSYIDPTPPVREIEEAETPILTSITQLQQLTRDSNVLFVQKKPLDSERRPRSRYRPARPQSRVPAPQLQDTREPRNNDREYTREGSTDVVAREQETSSWNDNAPRITGEERDRSVTDKNKDLPGSLRAQPPPLTKASLEKNDRRSRYEEKQHMGGLSNSTVRQFGGLPVPGPTIAADTGRIPSVSRSPHRNSRTRHSWHGQDENQQLGSRQSSRTREDSQGRRQSRRSLPPPDTDILPLRGDSGKVLVHSKSRGYKIVRNLVSLNGMRDMVCEHNNEPRHVASLERMAEEDRRASQELFTDKLHVPRHNSCDCGSATPVSSRASIRIVAPSEEHLLNE
ncbi:hypothetical protein DE146DRAFT_732889 [Phaeosphaeria sp. MPI-PUGE-AT-0046c]|nr:hypothetical protein DE146DRAFT_732889 [Phaeosphaeria sp. MPI-PUGE-AT-0046c]